MRRLGGIESLEERRLLAVRVWDGGGTNNNFSTPANWVGNVAPVADDSLVFPASTAGSLVNDDFAAGTRFRSITFAGSGYNLVGNTIDLTEGIVTSNTTGNNSVSLNLVIDFATTYTASTASAAGSNTGETFISGNAGTSLTLGNIDLGAQLVLTLDGSGDFYMNGVISDSDAGVGNGAGSIYKNGIGTAYVSNANTYTGLTTVAQGVFDVENSAAMGPGGAGTIVNAGGQLMLGNANTGQGVNIAGPISLAGNGLGIGNAGAGAANPNGALIGLGALVTAPGTNDVISGNVQLLSNPTFIGTATDSTLNISGTMAGIGAGFEKVGAGTMIVSGTTDNMITGNVTALQGTLLLDKTGGAMPFHASMTIGDNLQGSQASIVRLGASNQIPELDFYNSALQTVTINASGWLDLNGWNDAIGNLTLVNGQTYSPVVTTEGSTLGMLGNMTVNAFEGTSPTSPPATIAGNLNLGGAGQSVTDSSSVTTSFAAFSGGAAATTRVITVNQAALASFDSDLTISANISGGSDVLLQKSGAGTLRLTGNNNYAGNTVLSAGAVSIGSTTAFSSGTVDVGAVTLTTPGNTSVAIRNAIAIDGNFTTYGAGNITFNGLATMTNTAANPTRTITVASPGQTLTFGGGLTDGNFALTATNGGQSLVKAGQGTLAITAASTYSGTTTINNGGGTIVLSGSGTILNTTGITIGEGGTFEIDNSQNGPAGNISNRVNSSMGIALNGGTLDYIGAGTNQISSETLGPLTIAGNEASTVESTVIGSTASVALTFQTLTVGSGAMVNFAGIGTALSNGGVSANGNSNEINFIVPPPQTSIINGILPYAHVEGPSGGDLATFASNAAGVAVTALPAADYVTNPAAANANSNLLITTNTTLTSPITVNALVLAGGATLSGPAITVSSGRVVFASGNDVLNTAVASLNPLAGQAYLTAAAGASGTVNSVIINGNVLEGANYQSVSLHKDGAGTVTLTAENQYTGLTIVGEGILDIQNSSALGSNSNSAASAVMVEQGATLQLDAEASGPVQVLGKSLTLDGFGYNGMGALTSITNSALYPSNLNTSNSWSGTVTLAGTPYDAFSLAQVPSFPSGTFINVVSNAQGTSSLTLSNTVQGASQDLVKMGGGTLTLAGDFANTYNGTTRVLAGTLALDKAPGLNAVAGPIVVGNDQGGMSPATLSLGASNQIIDNGNIQLNSGGTFNLNGFSDVVGTLTMVEGPVSSASINMGAGMLTLGGFTSGAGTAGTAAAPVTLINVEVLGGGNANGAVINGNIALNTFYYASTAPFRQFIVNQGSAAVDLNINGAITDGTGLVQTNLTKAGFGTLEFSGSTNNTYLGTTTLNEGTLLLGKLSGVQAIGGALTVGDGSINSGGAQSDVVRFLNDNQTPSGVAPITINNTGLLDLNGHNDTIGNLPDQTALTMTAGIITLGGGTLTLGGDVVVNTSPAQSIISGGNLDLGSAPRTLTTTHNAALRDDIVISANIVDANTPATFLSKAGTGVLLLSGNSTFAGGTYLTAGDIDIGSDTALGTGAFYISGTTILVYGGAHTISNPVFTGSFNLGTVGITGIADADPITFAGPVDLLNNAQAATPNATVTTNTFTISTATYATFAGGLGDEYGDEAFQKAGTGFAVVNSAATYSGVTTVTDGSLILTGAGALVNTSAVNINPGGTLDIDNYSGGYLSDRVFDSATIGLAGGALLYRAAPGVANTETLGTMTISTSEFSPVSAVQNTIATQIDPSTAGTTATLVFSTFTRNVGANVNFVGFGSQIGGGSASVIFNTLPAEMFGLFQFATMSTYVSPDYTSQPAPTNLDFVTQSAAATTVAAASWSSSLAGANSTSNLKLSGANNQLTSNLTINALYLANGATLDTNGFTLTIASGELISSETGNLIKDSTGTTGTLDFGVNEANVFVDSGLLFVPTATPSLTITTAITGINVFRKERAGTLVLSGNSSTFTGNFVVDQGALDIQNSNALGTALTNAVQDITLTSATTGTFTLVFSGQTTGTITWNANVATTAANIQTALAALSNIGTNNVTVTGEQVAGTGGAVGNIQLFTVNFVGTLKGTVEAAMTGTFTALTGATGAITVLVAGGNGAFVADGAALQIGGSAPVTISSPIVIVGAGIAGTGALVALPGSNATLSPPAGVPAALDLRSTSTTTGAITMVIGVEGNGQLTINGPITGSNTAGGALLGNALVKIGTGTLTFAGTTANLYTGTTTVAEGTLTLAKTSGIAALAGSVIVGDNFGTGDTLNILTTEQVAIAAAVTVNTTGTINVNPSGTSGSSVNQETLGAITLEVGPLGAGTINIGSGDILALNGTLTVATINQGTTNMSPASPTIAGPGLLALAPTSGTTRTITVADTPLLTDLIITAGITDIPASGTAGANSISKAGAGRLVLAPTTNNSNYSGTTTVTAGELMVTQSSSLGTGANPTIVTGGSLILSGGVTISGHSLQLNTTVGNAQGGGVGVGVLHSMNGDNVWDDSSGGSVSLGAIATIGVDALTATSAASSLNIIGTISGTGATGLTKLLPGTLILSGNTNNTYTGTTTVSEGTLALNKTPGVNNAPTDAIAAGATLVIGNDAGGQSVDQVMFLNNNQIDPLVVVTINTTGLLNLNGFNETLSAATNALLMQEGGAASAVLSLGGGAFTLGSNTANSGNVTVNTTGTLSLAGPSVRLGDNTGGTFTLSGVGHTMTVTDGTFAAGTNDLTIALPILSANTAATLTKAGTGTLELTANNTGYGSTMTLSAGGLAVPTAQALGANTLTVNGTTAILRGESSMTIANPIALGTNAGIIGGNQPLTFSGTIAFSGTNTLTIADQGGVTFAGSTMTLTSGILTISDNFNAPLNIKSIVNGGGALTKSGLGTLSLGGANSFTGTMTINQGIVQANSTLALGAFPAAGAPTVTIASGAALQITPGLTLPYQFSLGSIGFNNNPTGGIQLPVAAGHSAGTGLNATLTGSINLVGNGAIGVDGGGSNPDAILLKSPTAPTNYSQVILGTGALLKVGAGILELESATNASYSGGTFVDNGTLILNSNSTSGMSTGTGNLTIGTGGGSADVAFGSQAGPNQIASTANITVLNTGTLDLSGSTIQQTAAVSQTLSQLILYNGENVSASVIVGINGTLFLNGTTNNIGMIEVDNFGMTDGAATQASINGGNNFVDSLDFTNPTSNSLIISPKILPASPATSLNDSVQVVNVTSGATFTLTFKGQTATIPVGDTPSDVQARLAALSMIGSGNVLVGGAPNQYYVMFIGNLSGSSVPTLTGSANASVTRTTDAVQLLSPSSAGSYSLSFGGQTTPAVPFSAGAAQIQSSLQTLSTIGAGNVIVVGSPGAYYVAFTGGLANSPVASITYASPDLTLAGTIGGPGNVNIVSETALAVPTILLTNTAAYSGTTSITGVTLDVSSASGHDGSVGATSTMTLGSGATLIDDNSTGGPAAGRLGTGAYNLAGGSLEYFGQPGAAMQEAIGAVTLVANTQSTIESWVSQAAGSSLQFSIASLTRSAGSYLSLIAGTTGQEIADSTTTGNNIFLQAAPTGGAALVGGGISAIFPYMTVTSTNGQVDWGTLGGPATTNIIPLPLSDYSVNALAPGADVLVTDATALANLNQTQGINSILFRGSNLTIGGVAGSGGTPGAEFAGVAAILDTGLGNSITIDQLDFGNNELTVNVLNPNETLVIDSGITGSGLAGIGMSKFGAGTLALGQTASSVKSTYNGLTEVVTGTLSVQANNALGNNASGTVVQNGATVQLVGSIDAGTEALTLNGTGVNGQGALLNADGVNNWDGTVTYVGASAIGSNGGLLNLTGVLAATSVGNAAVQVITENSASGTMVLAYNGADTGTTLVAGPAPNGSTSAQVQAALLALPTIGGVGEYVTVTGNQGGPYTVTFFGPLGSNLQLLTGSASVGTITVTSSATFNTINKLGPGNLELSGTANNTFSGTMTVNEGTLLLGKNNPAVTTQASLVAVPGALVIGDGLGLAYQQAGSPDQVKFIAGANGTQISSIVNGALAGSQTATLFPWSLLDLEGNTSAINNLNLLGGTVNTETGSLTLNGTMSYFAGNQALVTGNLVLPTNVKTFSFTNDGEQFYDVKITAAISGSGGFIQTGSGGLLLTNPNNSFTGSSATETVTVVPSTTNSFVLTLYGQTTPTIGVSPAGNPNPTFVQEALASLTTIGAGAVIVGSTSGTFTLSFGGYTTGPIPYNDSVNDVQDQLQALPSVGDGNLLVGGAAGSYIIAFENGLLGTSINSLGIDTTNLGPAPGNVPQATITGPDVSVTGVKNAANNIVYTISFSGIFANTSVFPALAATFVSGTANPTVGVTNWGGGVILDNANAILGVQTDTSLGAGSTPLGTGAISLFAGQIIAVGSNETINNPLTVSGTVILGGRTDQGSNYGLDFTTAAALSLTGNTTFEIDDPNTPVEIDGNLTEIGPGMALTKTGVGTLVVSGQDSYSGNTNVTAGVLQISNSSALGAPELGQIQTASGTLGASFTLTYAGSTTTNLIAGTSTAAQVATALDELASIGGVGGSVNVTEAVRGNTIIYTITFGGSLTFTTTAMTGSGITVATVIPGASGTTIANGAELDISGNLSIGDEPLTMTGEGYIGNITGSGGGPGALRVMTGVTTWGNGTTPMTIGTGTASIFNTIGTDSGELTLNGTLAFGVTNSGLDKVGPGTLVFGGPAATSYNGTTTVSNGVLVLDKSAAQGIAGALTIGDNISPSATVILATPEQIPDTVAITINSNGQLNTLPAQGTTAVNTLMSMTLTGVTSGQYRITFMGVSTPDLAFNTPAAGVQTAINNLLGQVMPGAYVTVDSASTTQMLINFQGTAAGENLPPLVVIPGTTPNNGTITFAQVTPGSNDVGFQTAQISGAGGNFTFTYNGQTTSTLSYFNTNFAPGTGSIIVTGSAGTFQLIFGGQTTGPMPFNDSPSDVQSQLGALPTIGNGNVTVTGSAGNYLVQFQGALAGTAVSNITATFSGGDTVAISASDTSSAANVQAALQALPAIGAGNVAVSSAYTSTQTVVVTGTSGNFTLSFNGASTGNLAFNATAATVQAALDSLITTENVVLSGATGGTFELVYNGVDTAPLAWNAAASDVQAALNDPSIPLPGGVTSVVTGANGGPYTITWSNISTLEPGTLSVNSQLTGNNPTGNVSPAMSVSVASSSTTVGGQTQTTYTVTMSGVSYGGASNALLLGTAQTLNAAGSISPQGIPGTETINYTIQFLNGLASSSLPLSASSGTPVKYISYGIGGERLGGAATGVQMWVGQNSAAQINMAQGTDITLKGGVTVTSLPGFSTYDGTTIVGRTVGAQIDGGTLNLLAPNATASGTTAFTVNSTPAGDDLYVSSAVADGYNLPTGVVASLTKTGTGIGRMVLAGNNTYSGTTTISAGALTAANSTALGTVNANNVTIAPSAVGGSGSALELLSGSETQTVAVNASAGSFYLTFQGQTTSDLAYNAPASAVQAALNALTSISSNGSVTVTASNSTVAAAPNTIYTIVFGGNLASSNQPQIIGNTSATTPLSGGLATITEMTLLGGGPTVIGAKPLTITLASTVAAGFLGNGSTAVGVAPVGQGGLRNLAGNNTFGGAIALNAANGSLGIGVDSGSLTLTNNITQSTTTLSTGLIKLGAGTLQLANTVANNYAGLTTVASGTLLLNAPVQVGSSLLFAVGGDGPAASTPTLQWGPNANNPEIAIGSTIYVDDNGVLDLTTNNNAQTVATVYNAVGPTSSSLVEGGAGLTAGTWVSIAMAGTNANSSPALVTGTIVLAAARNFNIYRSGITATASNPVAAELNITGNVIGGAGGIIKNDLGTLELSGNDGYTGATTVSANGGTLVAASPTALTSTSSVTVNIGGSLGLYGGITTAIVSLPNININGQGVTSPNAVMRSGAIDNLGGTNTLSDAINLNSAATIGSDAGTLILSKSIFGNTFPVTIAGAGNVTANGAISGASLTKGNSAADIGTLTLNSNSNSYGGSATTVNGGTLAVNNTTNLPIVANNNSAITGTGVASSTVTLNGTSTISPGTIGTPGSLSVGPVAFGNGTTYVADINGTSAGTGYDQLLVNGALNLNGSNLVLQGGVFIASTGTTFNLLTTTGSLTGTFSGIPNGQSLQVGALIGTVNYTSNSVQFTVTSQGDLPPTINTPPAQVTNENVALTFPTGTTALSVTSLDNPIQVTLSVGKGTLTLNGTSGLTFESGTTNGSSTIIVQGSPTDIDTALSGLVYTPNYQVWGSDTLSINVNDLFTGTGGPQSSSATVGITINEIDQSPVNTLPGPQTVTQNQAFVFSPGNSNQISVSDVDSNNNPEQVTLSVGQGTLKLAQTTGLSITAGANGSATMTIKGTLSAINSALSGLTYTPGTDYLGGDSLTITTNDLGNSGAGGPLVSQNTLSLNVVRADQAPVLNVPGQQQVNVNTTGSPTSLVFQGGTAITVSDVDANGGVEQLAISSTLGTITLGNTGGLTFTAGGNNTSSMTIQGTLPALNAALAGMTFVPTLNQTGQATITITANDLGNSGPNGPQSTTASIAVIVGTPAVPPTINVPNPQTMLENGIFTFTGTTAITVSDPNVGTKNFQVMLTAPNGTITLGSTAGVVITSGANGTNSITIQGTISAINSDLNNLSFAPANNFTGATSIQVQANDLGNGGVGGPKLVTTPANINVQPNTDQAPVNSVPGSLTVDENTPITLNGSSAISVSDADAGNAPVQVSLSLAVTSSSSGAPIGTFSLASTSGLTFSTGTGANDTSEVFTGTITAINKALNGLTYSPGANFYGTGTLTVSTNDLGHSGAGGPLATTSTVPLTVQYIKGQNQAPVNTVPGAQQVGASGTLTFSSANKNQISATDVDEQGNNEQVTLSVANGTLTLATTNQVTVTSGANGSGQMVLLGTLAYIDAAMNGMVYTPNGGFQGTDTLTISTSDLGATNGDGTETTPRISTSTVSISVSHVNQAPTITAPTNTGVIKGNALVFSAANKNQISVNDADSGGAPEQLTLTATNGTFTLATSAGLSITAGSNNSASLTAQGSLTDLDNALNGLTFTPTSGFSGSASLQVTISDLGNAGLGGALTASTTIHINVLPHALINTSGNTVVVTSVGTNDSFSMSFSSSTQYTITADGFSQSFSTTSYPHVTFDGSGDATADVTGNGSTLNATFYPNSATLSGSGYDVSITKTPTISVNGTADGTASFFDGTGTYSFIGTPTYAQMTGGGTTNTGAGFGTVYGYASNANDVAYLYDNTGTTNNFVSTPTYAYLTAVTGPSYFNEASGFHTVLAVSASGATDTAYFYTGVGLASTFIGTQTYASALASSYDNEAIGFATNLAISDSVSDIAYLYDTSGANEFIGTSQYATFSGTGFNNGTMFFQNVLGVSGSGADTAYLYGASTGSNNFVSTPTYSYLVGPGYENQVYSFAQVLAVSNGGNDTADFIDSAAADTFFGYSNFSAMMGSGFDNGALYFKLTNASGANGSSDNALLFDSAGDDSILAFGNSLTMNFSTNNSAAASTTNLQDFETVDATSSSGGTDTISERSVDYALTTTGHWINQ